MNIAPTARASHVAERPEAPNCVATRAAHQATNRFQSVPLKLKTSPRNRKDSALLGASGAMNCGKNARKKSATLGFSTFVSKPCRNTVESGAGGSDAEVVGSRGRESRNETPTYSR